MNLSEISPDDPRLTAYALHEMAPAERRAFEQALQHNPAARQAVEEIRATIASLTSALEQEPLESAGAVKINAGATDPYRAKVIRFPHFYYVVSGIAAACFAVFFIFWQRDYQPKQRMRLVEVPLTATAESNPEASAEDMQTAESFELARPVMAMPAPAPAIGRAWGFAAESHAARAENYAYRKDNDYVRVADQPLSTFSADVDTASYSNVRRFLGQRQRPPVDAVRIEELVNYFPYNYPAPTGSAPFAASLEVASAPWAPGHRLVRIGLKGREVSPSSRPPVNLVFLVDVSGSMDQPEKLPLLKQSLRLLVNQLREDDQVAIAVYAGASGMALPSTKAAHRAEILEAIERLEAQGSTNGAAGIQLAYEVARANFIAGGVNRVVLATDGDFNVGATSESELVRLIAAKAKDGVFLSVLGFGMGNLQDTTLELLADKGNGNYAYIDSLAEARKALVEQAGGTLVTIAQDVKLQVEFNPALVQAYRLIGYENRLLTAQEFNDDKIDAGEIGAGHTVTALYEVVPVGVELEAGPGIDSLKYQRPAAPGQRTSVASAEMLTLKIRYKEPVAEESQKLEFVLHDHGARFEEATPDFKFAAAVAAFGMELRDSPHKGKLTLQDVTAWARAGLGSDFRGYRSDFIGLVAQAQQVLEE